MLREVPAIPPTAVGMAVPPHAAIAILQLVFLELNEENLSSGIRL